MTDDKGALFLETYLTQTMNTTPLILIFTMVGLTGSARAVADLPDAEIKGFIEKYQMPQIEARPGARLQRDYESLWLKWFERCVAVPFAERLKSEAAVRERALRVVSQGIMLVRRSPQRDPAFTAGVMMAECEALLKAGVDDPLIYWLQGHAIYGESQDFPGFESAYKKAVRHPQFKSMPAAQRLLTMAGFESIAVESRRTKSGMIPRGEELIEAAWTSLQEGSYQRSADEHIFPERESIHVVG